MSIDVEKLLEELKRDEGYRDCVYTCSAGKLTIGYGHNVEDNPISDRAAELILLDDVGGVISRLEVLPWWRFLDGTRKRAMINMAFNLGFAGMMKFKKMIAAIEKKNFEQAATEMLNSRWADQVGERADRLAKMMFTGE
jgi:lysozyme